MILASEDIGVADPLALVVADAAARAVEFVGLPEAQLNLAQAVDPPGRRPQVEPGHRRPRAGPGRRAGRAPRRGPRPPARRHYRGARALGHGEGYRYPHDDPRGWVDQDYRPPEVADHVYYEPSEHGAEAALAERLRHACGAGPTTRTES